MDSRRYRTDPAVASSEVDGEITLLDPRSGLYFGLEDVGAEVWRLLAEPRSVAELCDALLAEYDVSQGECEADVSGLLGELVARGLVEVVSAA